MKTVGVLSLLLVLSCSGTSFSQAQTPGPFDGVGLKALSAGQRLIITQASEDFEAVRSGHPPIHAKIDKEAALLADGGTSYFVGLKYKLTIVKSLSSISGLNGYVYGPVIDFDKSIAPGNTSEISSLRFYTVDQLKKLLKKD